MQRFLPNRLKKKKKCKKMVWGFSEDKAAALDAPRTEPYMGKGAFFICISITGASRLKCYNKEGKYILIYL